jgi:magnesium transporter
MVQSSRRRDFAEIDRMGEVTAAILRDGRVIEHVALDAAMTQADQSDVVWIEVLDPADGDFTFLQQRFHLHDLAIEDSMSPSQVAKVDLYDDQIFVVLKTARLVDGEIRYGEVDAFVSSQHVITVCHGAGCGHAHGRFQAGITPAQMRPDFVLHGILDFVVNAYFPVVQRVMDEVLTMEQHLQDALLDRREITRLFRLRREAIHFQQVISRMADVCGKLIHLEVPCIGADARPYFRDVRDHLVRLDAMVSSLVEIIRTVFEASSLLELQRQGMITRQLASWASILAVPTAIVGAYGAAANKIPVLHSPLALAAAAGVMMTLCLLLYVRFRKLNWL